MACVQKHMNAQVPKHICKHDVTPERKIRRGKPQTSNTPNLHYGIGIMHVFQY